MQQSRKPNQTVAAARLKRSINKCYNRGGASQRPVSRSRMYGVCTEKQVHSLGAQTAIIGVNNEDEC